MNIRTELCKEQSATQRLLIVSHILENNADFAELMAIVLGEDYRLQQRSSWIVGRICLKKPQLLHPYYKAILRKLALPSTPDAFKRNVVRTWADTKIPELFLGDVYEACFRFLTGKEAIAIKAFSMIVCYKISQQFPELKSELLVSVEDVIRTDGPTSKGILSRGGKTLKLLKKDLNLL